MASPTSYVQDAPPPEGFKPITYKRNLPSRGPSGFVLLSACLLTMGYGWYWSIQGIFERRELSREKIWSRIHLIPLLQSELDRQMDRFTRQQRKLEEDIMKDVPGWKVGESVYHGTRNTRPKYMIPDPQWTKKI
ncbi:hypothetical protein HMI54_013906 [Coelomomyces lativittatus]|nr:hypothetical protein HMI56_002513 [Coelomomyces lativittatus]KAJ1506592.1 hypothetical protein HMI55_001108 [Coelomomyces lativittatus]KAJ1514592.1 hypothetical protein HMI54_013906 [Coelomomyces lativittatus]